MTEGESLLALTPKRKKLAYCSRLSDSELRRTTVSNKSKRRRSRNSFASLYGWHTNPSCSSRLRISCTLFTCSTTRRSLLIFLPMFLKYGNISIMFRFLSASSYSSCVPDFFLFSSISVPIRCDNIPIKIPHLRTRSVNLS